MSAARILPLLLLLPVFSTSCLQSRSAFSKQPEKGALIRVSGVISNSAIISGKPIWVQLTVTNVTDADLYVPTHFNSNNYTFELTGDAILVSSFSHGDSRGATFEDFVRLKPGESARIAHYFTLNDEVGEGRFSAHFYNNLLSEVERKLKATGVPFAIEVSHSFGQIRVQASNKIR